MSVWRVRHEGSPHSTELPSANAVLAALVEGDWEPTDEVRGPDDARWVPIEEHPQFAEAAAELEPPKGEPPDESHLDMNPLIDVALVLLIFFILTTSYAALRRAIDLPPEPSEGQSAKVVKQDDLKDRTFTVRIRMERGLPTATLNDAPVTIDELEHKVKDAVRATGRRELIADISDDVPWGIEAKLYDAAKAADVHQIYWPKGK